MSFGQSSILLQAAVATYALSELEPRGRPSIAAERGVAISAAVDVDVVIAPGPNDIC